MFRRSILNYFFIVLLVYSGPSYAGLGKKVFGPLLGLKASCKQVITGNYSPKIKLKSFSEIDSRVQLWIHINERKVKSYLVKSKEGYKLNSGAKLNVGSYDLKVLFLLGVGGEGEVYLVQGSQGLMVVKYYYRGPNYISSLIEELKTTSGIYPRIIEKDLENKILLLEYFEGIPVSQIINMNDIGLPEATVKKVRKLWESSRFKFGKPYNTVYSFKTKKFKSIDPH